MKIQRSRSKVGKMDYASLRPYLDEAFALRDQPPPAPEPSPARDALTQAVESGLAKINGEAAAVPTVPDDGRLDAACLETAIQLCRAAFALGAQPERSAIERLLERLRYQQALLALQQGTGPIIAHEMPRE